MVVVVATLCLSSCAFRPLVTRDALDFNRSVEEAHNELILTNVLRAADREPLLFTELAKITGSITGQVGLDLKLPFDRPLEGFSASPSGSMRGGPTFDVLNLSSKDFMSGIMTPVSPALLAYYWDQGWPRELLLYLLIRKVHIAGDPEPFVNYPPDREEFLRFQGFVTCAARGDATLRVEDDSVKVSPGFAGVTSEAVVAASKEKLVWKEEGGAIYLFKPVQRVVLGFNCEHLAVPAEVATEDEQIIWDAVRELQELSVEKRRQSIEQARATSRRGGGAAPPDALAAQYLWFDIDKEGGPRTGLGIRAAIEKERKPEDQTRLFVRSPEAIFYYLGELTREQLHDPAFPVPAIETRFEQVDARWPLFVVREGRSQNAEYVVSRDGKRFFIPRGPGAEAGRTMSCFTLLTQLLALHKSRDTLPTTQTVIGVGGP